MKHHSNQDHPEVHNMKNICRVSANKKRTGDVCDKMKRENYLRTKKEENNALDEALDETFPASDATAKY